MWKCVLTAGILLASVTDPALAQRLVLVLDDGTPMWVREYEIDEDRVRYFSLERGQWEVVPVSIVDLEATGARNRAAQAEALQKEAEERRERIAERRARTELHGVPLDDGVYYLRDGKPVLLEQAVFEIGRSKGRTALNVIAPVPVMAGKRTLSIQGLSATAVSTDPKPVFYMRLERFSRFGIARVKPQKGKERRVVQFIFTVPRAEEQAEVQDDVEVFRQQLAPRVYKIWPVEPLEAGEYAVVAYTPGETDLRAWDFRQSPAP